MPKKAMVKMKCKFCPNIIERVSKTTIGVCFKCKHERSLIYMRKRLVQRKLDNAREERLFKKHREPYIWKKNNGVM